jgi:FAD/FMN-containing dehydrogenase
MTTATSIDVVPLRSAVSAPVLGPADPGWDAARQAWNLLADQQPDAIAFANTPGDVRAIVDFARERGLKVAAQGTGHAATSLGSLAGTILLKTMRMGGVEVDPAGRTARVEAGALLGELAVAAGEHGLAVLSGSSPDVGVVGFSLGGGIGWLSRRHGLACNSISAIELVTAEGETVRADAHNEPDLFWAMRGGGGNFGVVTALELHLVEVPDVYAGGIMWPAERAPEVFEAYRSLAATAPPEFSSEARFLSLPPIPEVPEPLRGRPLVHVTGAFLGSEHEARDVLAPLRELGEPVMDTFGIVDPAAITHIHGDPEQPTPGMTHHTVLRELEPKTIDTLVESAGPESGSPLLAVGMRHLGGALGEAPEGAGALDRLDGEFALYGVGIPMVPEMAPAIDAHLDRVVEAMQPWSTGGEYLNLADRPGDASRGFGAGTYARLKAIRAQVDPKGMFSASHPIV